MDISNIGDFLRSKRRAKGLTQSDVAECLMVSAQAVSKWERGENLPDVALFPDIAKILGVNVDEILGAGTKMENAASPFELLLNEIKMAASFTETDIDLDHFVYFTAGQKARFIQEILTMRDYYLAFDDILPYCNNSHRAVIITHILEKQDFGLLEQLSNYMGNEMKADALNRLLHLGRYDIIEDNMPAFTRKHRDIIVDFIGANPKSFDEETIENFIPFFDNNQRERLRDSLN